MSLPISKQHATPMNKAPKFNSIASLHSTTPHPQIALNRILTQQIPIPIPSTKPLHPTNVKIRLLRSPCLPTTWHVSLHFTMWKLHPSILFQISRNWTASTYSTRHVPSSALPTHPPQFHQTLLPLCPKSKRAPFSVFTVSRFLILTPNP
jgi:hypothetical protein